MKMRNCVLDINTKDLNFHKENPVTRGDEHEITVNGKKIKELFYIIDFADIQDNSYVISSFGRVFSFYYNSEIQKVDNGIKYNTIQLKCNDGKTRRFMVARLVARAFLKKTDDDKKFNRFLVHRKNWDYEDDIVYNLEWRSPLEMLIMSRIKNNTIDTTSAERLAKKLFRRDMPLKQMEIIFNGYYSRQKLVAIRDKRK